MTNLELSAVGFAVALVAGLAGTPIARRVALRHGVLDRPAGYKRHGRPTPYLGGIAILAAILVATLGTGAWRAMGGLIAGAVLLAITGLADDIASLGPVTRLLVQSYAAMFAIAMGIRATPTGIFALDVAITFVWIVGLTNALNLLDNMNGLSAGIAGIASASLFALAAMNGQYLVAALAATVAGGVVGFLPYNYPHARIFMGDAGSTLLGFLVAVIALKVEPVIAHPWSFAVPVCILAVPILDTSLVVFDRLRAGRPVASGGHDHLSHRLVALGFSRPRAVAVLYAVAAAGGLAGVAIGRGLVPAPAVFGVFAVLAAFGIAMLRVRVDEQRRTIDLRRFDEPAESVARTTS